MAVGRGFSPDKQITCAKAQRRYKLGGSFRGPARKFMWAMPRTHCHRVKVEYTQDLIKILLQE